MMVSYPDSRTAVSPFLYSATKVFIFMIDVGSGSVEIFLWHALQRPRRLSHRLASRSFLASAVGDRNSRGRYGSGSSGLCSEDKYLPNPAGGVRRHFIPAQCKPGSLHVC